MRLNALAVALILAVASLIARSSPAGEPKPEGAGVVAARVSLYRDAAGKRVEREVTINDEARIRTLVGFLPGVGSGRTSNSAAAWEADVVIMLTRADGSQIRVSSNFESWSEGKGDWDVEAGFEQFVRGLFP